MCSRLRGPIKMHVQTSAPQTNPNGMRLVYPKACSRCCGEPWSQPKQNVHAKKNSKYPAEGVRTDLATACYSHPRRSHLAHKPRLSIPQIFSGQHNHPKNKQALGIFSERTREAPK